MIVEKMGEKKISDCTNNYNNGYHHHHHHNHHRHRHLNRKRKYIVEISKIRKWRIILIKLANSTK